VKLAVVGAGWAGLSAAVALRDAGCAVTVYEAGRTPGGRARRVPHEGGVLPFDNGQHILLGAYTDTLALMRRLGRDPRRLFLRQPLRLSSLDGSFRLAAPRLPAPWHAAVAILSAHGLSWRDGYAVMRSMRSLRASNWTVPAGETVAQMLGRLAQPGEAIRLLWEPLCLAALNTPVAQACAQLFTHVLRDSLAGRREASDMLLPRVDLSELWPDTAAAMCAMRYGHTVKTVDPGVDGVAVDGERYDAAVVALPPAATARVLEQGAARGLAAGLADMPHAPIATLTLRLAGPWRLPQPMMMLHDDPAAGHDGQWVFDRARLAGQSDGPGEIAIVASAAMRLAQRDRTHAIDALTAQVRQQAAKGGLPAMPTVDHASLLIDKRATFLALPGLPRAAQATAWRTLALAGDWTDTGYPGVLEGAVRSGQRAAAWVIAGCAR
jgi:squalene-associated FAD-dependent desaturase